MSHSGLNVAIPMHAEGRRVSRGGAIRQPSDTILILISDLYEGSVRAELLKRAASLKAAGVQMIALLAVSHDGAPSYDHQNAAALAALEVPSFACTPDLFPDMMAAAISRRNLNQWAAANSVVTSRHDS